MLAIVADENCLLNDGVVRRLERYWIKQQRIDHTSGTVDVEDDGVSGAYIGLGKHYCLVYNLSHRKGILLMLVVFQWKTLVLKLGH